MRERLARLEQRRAWLYAAPATVLMLVFVLLPITAVTAISLTDWQLGARDFSFQGITNYVEMFRDRVFWKSLGNTFAYVAYYVPASIVLALALAIAVEASGPLRGFYRTAFFLPVATTFVAMAVVWEFMLHPDLGLVTIALTAIGLPKENWLGMPDTVLMALAAIGIWLRLGFYMVLFIAGLRSIPRELYEAAAVDGASTPWRRFRLVTWPMLAPTTLFVAVIALIQSFQVFETVAVLTRGGPSKSSEVLLYTMYTEAFTFLRTAYASSITVVFMLIVFAITIVKTRLLEPRIHYK
ncbi:MAG: sugar ABC transporter permease [Rhodoferax sp.]|nr:sugar ABC transporter permease [Rhodoferax sp.]MCP5182300.1 sugar ABC transporter permease [Pseudomonadales bacterium]